ncbi:MAG: stage II sporulation protein M [Xenococcus sp. MO_188.B8]|nr:stage II sporulation protein M [Xenococcus sp. MO_188.B8]
MNIQRWIARREINWKTLDNLLRQAETKGLKSLSAEQIKQLASLYRSISADLARAQTKELGSTLIGDLQRLTARGYNQVYQGSRRHEWQGVKEFYLWGFPQVVRDSAVYIALATGIFFLPALIAWWYAWQDPVFIDLTVPESIIEAVRDRGELWMGSIVGHEPLASSSIMTNNLSVAFKAICGGATAGIYTIFIMAFNGLFLGSIGALVTQNNLGYPFWAFVFPHGALELPAIYLAGGAGLLIGKAMVFPGNYRRPDAVKKNATQAAKLLFGIVPMLIIAGIIEGFFSPNPAIPDAMKYFTGIGIFGLLIAYLKLSKNSTIAS